MARQQHERRRAVIIISCEVGESVVIGDNIVVTVVEIRGDKVRLGIEHPPEAPVHRREVLDAIRSTAPRAESPR
jgi:carbon storage regulator